MSKWEEAFPPQDGRPNHPDLWRLSKIVHALDGVSMAGEGLPSIAKFVDFPSLLYMFQQRAQRLFSAIRPGRPPSVEELSSVGAAYVEGFIVGYKFAKGSEDSDDAS